MSGFRVDGLNEQGEMHSGRGWVNPQSPVSEPSEATK